MRMRKRMSPTKKAPKHGKIGIISTILFSTGCCKHVSDILCYLEIQDVLSLTCEVRLLAEKTRAFSGPHTHHLFQTCIWFSHVSPSVKMGRPPTGWIVTQPWIPFDERYNTMLSEVTGVFISTSAAAGPTQLVCVPLLADGYFPNRSQFFLSGCFWGFGLGLATCGDNLLCAVEIRKNKQGPIISFLCSLLAMDMSDQLTIGQSHLAWKCSKKSEIGKDFHLNYWIYENH